ncbi:MAG: histidinol phosphate phosphatase domain-containing protein [Candidatus Omnitrophica bacterium]|nr:histidinol phosphate phosphatase domain-containing protein [Candidatus Omnitrophota bacterium]
MIDLHTHTILSDGCLVPSELVRRAHVMGYKVLGITDHVDRSNIEHVLSALVKVCKDLSKKVDIKLIPGVELTHIPLEDFKDLTAYARSLGACLVIGHGETLSEPVISGTNRAAIEAGVDIVAHPGLITADDVKLAASKGIYLEISARAGHCLGNGHVARLGLQYGTGFVVNTDSHGPDNLITREKATNIALGAGLTLEQIKDIINNGTACLVKKSLERFAAI